MQFTDRADAGRRLADALRNMDLTPGAADAGRPVVLGLPRGGIPVAWQVARALGAPLDVLVVRKLGVPGQPELAYGAVGEDGVRVVSDDIVRRTGSRQDDLDAVERAEKSQLDRQAQQFRQARRQVPVAGRTVVLIDDGIATGATAAAACHVARAQGAARVVLAVPTAAPDAVERLRGAADDVVCLTAPPAFRGVGEWYADFSQVSDEEVVSLLSSAEGSANGGAEGGTDGRAGGQDAGSGR